MAQFEAQAAPLLNVFYFALRQYAAACCRSNNYEAEAATVRAYQAAITAFTDGLAGLTPPTSAVAAIQNYIASLRTYLANNGKVLTAILARDPAAIKAAIHSNPYQANLVPVLVALGVHDSDGLGYWDGTVTQHGPGTTIQSYFVEMTVKGSAPGATAGTIDYPSLHCSGHLQLSSAQGILQVYREQITSGPSGCGTGGTIYAMVLGGSMSWRWVAPGIVVVGSLDHLQRPGF